MWRNGTTKTTTIGYVNRNNQLVQGTRGVTGTDHCQVSYKMECLEKDCCFIYGANGSYPKIILKQTAEPLLTLYNLTR